MQSAMKYPSAPQLQFSSLPDFGLEQSADLLTRAFSDYRVKIGFSVNTLLQATRADAVDLSVSKIMIQNKVPIGGALLARRGWTSRLAAMALVPEARRRGAGAATVLHLLTEAKTRGDHAMLLEVIEQNEPAVKLYQSCGFRTLRRLVGFAGPGENTTGPTGLLEEVDLRTMGAVVTANSLADFPWQLSGETLAVLTPPSVAYRSESLWIALSNLDSPQITIRGLVAEGGALNADDVSRLFQTVRAKHPGKEWRLAALWPEELAHVFDRTGLKRLPLSQWQMAHPLT